MIHPLRLSLLSLACGLLLSLAPTTPPNPLPTTAPALQGQLLIIGGGIGDDAPNLFSILAKHTKPGGTIGVIPTASGEPDESAAATVDRIKNLAPSLTPKILRITQTDTHLANDPETAAQIAACDALFFTGGDQERILKVFRPEGAESALSRAVSSVLAKGGIVAGTSAGAAMMSNPMIMGGSSARILTPGEVLPMGPGMGLFPFGIVDQHFLERGRLGRLIIALEMADQPLGFGVSEDRALLADLSTATITSSNTDGILILDRRSSTRTGDNRSNLRISLLGAADTAIATTATITPAPARKPAAIFPDPTAKPADYPDAWDDLIIRDAAHHIAVGKIPSATLSDRHYILRLSADAQTQVFINPQNPKDLCIINLRLDLEKRATPLPPPPGN